MLKNLVVSFFFHYIVYINIKKIIIMGLNKELFNSIRERELSEESVLDKLCREMQEVAGLEHRETVKQIIEGLKPKENGTGK
jgi:hypothetical protein